MGTRRGMAIRFPETDVRSMGRLAAGVRGITLRGDDTVKEVAAFAADEEADILVVTDQGYGKRTPVSEFRIQGRGGLGIALVKLTDRNGEVAAIRFVEPSDQIMAMTERGIVIRTGVEEIRQAGRATQGVRVIRVEEGDRVVTVAKVEERDEDDDAEATEE